MILKISIEPALPTNNRSNITTHDRIESQSILAGGVGRVRSQFLEFSDDSWYKPAPTDP
jgi:hypothetical protein